MNYFELYPGDYRRDTARLSLAEHGAYLLLMADYYASEQPLPAGMADLYRIVGAQGAAEQRAVKAVADAYFPVAADGLRHNTRADREIAKAQKRIAISRQNGAKGGRKSEPKPNPNGTQRDTQQETRRDTQQPPQQTTRSGEALHTPHATRHTPPGSSAATDGTSGLDTHRERVRATPTEVGRACLLMRQAGLTSTSPQDPRLLAALEAGGTPEMAAHAAALAVSKGKGFAYALGVLNGLIEDAGKPRGGKTDPEAIHTRNRAIGAAWAADRAQEDDDATR